MWRELDTQTIMTKILFKSSRGGLSNIILLNQKNAYDKGHTTSCSKSLPKKKNM